MREGAPTKIPAQGPHIPKSGPAFLNPKNSSLGPQKVKHDPEIKWKSNVKIERNKED